MKTSIKKLINSRVRVSSCCILLFLFFLFAASNIIAMQDSSIVARPDSGAVSQSNEPSLQNMKKTGAVVTEEVKKMKEKQAREELLSYVYMVLGFGLVFVGAWFLTVQSRKRREKADEIKRQYLQNKVASQGGKTVHRDPHRRRGHKR